MLIIDKVGACVTLAGILLFSGSAHALSPADKCEADKLKTAGKYGFCRLNAEAKAVKTASTPDYSKCDDKYGFKWGRAESTAGMGVCPSEGDETAIQSFITQHTDDVAVALAGGPLPDCPGDLGTCNGDLSTCSSDLTQAQSDLTTCNGSLGVCSANLTTCNGSLGACSANLTTCNSNYASCSADLTTVNAGTAVQADLLSGKTFSSSSGLGLTGTMPNNGAVNITPSTGAQTIVAGYHNGSGSVAGDADLSASNIVKGVNIFGVTGTALPAQPLRTGQTQCDQGAGTPGACPGTPAGQDAAALKGATRSYTDNGDGTITDNRTGLMWEKLSDDGTIHDQDTFYTWYTAFTSKIATLNGGGGFAGYTDWRLPNRFELETLVDLGRVVPSIDPAFNTSCAATCTVLTCSCTRSTYYWSSTTYQGSQGRAWYVIMSDGSVTFDFKSTPNYVRAVRAGS